MANPFFEKPVLNNPYEYPGRHWELDENGQPTQKIIESRRKADFITPIPKNKKDKGKSKSAQEGIVFQDDAGLSTKDQQYELITAINDIRNLVDQWRNLSESQWQVTPETARLLNHWRNHKFAKIRPFFCQVEAVEVAIWLTEVAPHSAAGRKILERLKLVNENANPALSRIALKLATGAGKTTVMAMLIAWQAVNAKRSPNSKQFTRGFLVVTPGITIKERLQVLLPSDPDSYYVNNELVPIDMLDDVRHAKIVITNYHAFKLRERMELSAGGRALLKGRTGDPIASTETEGQMLARVMPDLMGMKNIMVLNDEAHHCYREKPVSEDEETLKGDDRKEADENNQTARLWITGLEMVKRKLGVTRVFDLSATPFFLQGSGYAEGTLFPWTVSDFSLMDAIECGIVKLPRVPVTENIPGDDMPVFRDLWKHVGKHMPKKSAAKAGTLNPLMLPTQLQTALQALYGHYEKTYEEWQKVPRLAVPPCFIIVCQNTAISKLVYDYVSGFEHTTADGDQKLENGRLRLFRNFDETTGNRLARPNTILIDSQQLESGEALDKDFRAAFANEIEAFRRDLIERTGDRDAADNLSDTDLLRAVMNTVGRPGQLGGGIRCVVSVSMLTEGWDARNVTHILGLRAFGTQLLCEQVIGRALRRQSYDLNEENLFPVEYADIFGIPFNFAAKPEPSPPQPPRFLTQVKAMRPERDHLEIRFPRVVGYRRDLPNEQVTARFTDDSTLELTPLLVGPAVVRNEGIIGKGIDLTLEHLADMRTSTLLMHLTVYLISKHYKDGYKEPEQHLFGKLKRVVKQWLDQCLICKGGTYPAQLTYMQLADMACEKIAAAITRSLEDSKPIKALLDPYNPQGTTATVRFTSTREDLYETRADRCHINYAVNDKGWERRFCEVVEAHPRVRAYVKNFNLGFEVPYRYQAESRRYLPDFIVLVDDGRGPDDLLHLVVEIKGYRAEDAKLKKDTMDTYWVPGVNNLKAFGRWAFAEFTEILNLEADFDARVEAEFDTLLAKATALAASEGK